MDVAVELLFKSSVSFIPGDKLDIRVGRKIIATVNEIPIEVDINMEIELGNSIESSMLEK